MVAIFGQRQTAFGQTTVFLTVLICMLSSLEGVSGAPASNLARRSKTYISARGDTIANITARADSIQNVTRRDEGSEEKLSPVLRAVTSEESVKSAVERDVVVEIDVETKNSMYHNNDNNNMHHHNNNHKSMSDRKKMEEAKKRKKLEAAKKKAHEMKMLADKKKKLLMEHMKSMNLNGTNITETVISIPKTTGSVAALPASPPPASADAAGPSTSDGQNQIEDLTNANPFPGQVIDNPNAAPAPAAASTPTRRDDNIQDTRSQGLTHKRNTLKDEIAY